MAGQEFTGKALAFFGAMALLLCCGGLGVIGALAPPPKQNVSAASDSTPPAGESTAPPTDAPAPAAPPLPPAPLPPAPTDPPSTPAPAPAPAAPPPPPPTDAPSWPYVPLNAETARARVHSQKLDPIEVTMFGPVVVVRYKPDVISVDRLIQHAGDDGLQTARVLSDHPDVTGVRTEILADFTDQYGNTTERVAVWSLVTKATMAKINWDGLKDRVAADGSDWLCLADGSGVYPAVWAKVETRHCLKLDAG